MASALHPWIDNANAHTAFGGYVANKAALDTFEGGSFTNHTEGLLALQTDIGRVDYLDTPATPSWSTLLPGRMVHATAPPSINDDSALGYSEGALWVEQDTDEAWVLTDVSAGAAVWLPATRWDANGQIVAKDGGSVSNPSFAFPGSVTSSGNPDLGLYASATDSLGLVTKGVLRGYFNSAGRWFFTLAGSEAGPSIQHSTYTGTGPWWPGADTIAWSTGGVEALRLDSTQDATFAGDVNLPSGGKATFDGGAGNYYIDFNGTSRMRFYANGAQTMAMLGGSVRMESGVDLLANIGGDSNVGSASNQFGTFYGEHLSLTQDVATSGTPAAIVTATGAAHTGLSSAEVTDLDFDMARTVTFTGGGGPVAAQRSAYFQAPTLSAGSALTFTKASTVAISGAPAAAGSAVISNPYALEVESGNSLFGGALLPNADGSIDIGSANSHWATVYGRAVESDSSLALRSGAATTLSLDSSQDAYFTGSIYPSASTVARFYADGSDNFYIAGQGGDKIYQVASGTIEIKAALRPDGDKTRTYGTSTRQFANIWSPQIETDGSLLLVTNSSTALTLDSTQDATFAGDVTASGDLDAAGGFRRSFVLGTHNSSGLAAASTTYQASSGSTSGSGGFSQTTNVGWIVCPRAGSIVEIAASVSSGYSAGTGDAEIFVEKSTNQGSTWTAVWGTSGTGAVAVGNTTAVDTATQSKDTDQFAAGDLLRVSVHTPSGWSAPGSTDALFITLTIEA